MLLSWYVINPKTLNIFTKKNQKTKFKGAYLVML